MIRLADKAGFCVSVGPDGYLSARPLDDDAAPPLSVTGLGPRALVGQALAKHGVAALARLVRESRFRLAGDGLELSALGPGGWNEDVHGTITAYWARIVGFDERQADVIAQACLMVDGCGPLSHLFGPNSPSPIAAIIVGQSATPQGYHFDTAVQTKADLRRHSGTAGDTRLVNARTKLAKAIKHWFVTRDVNSALMSLGTGLHCIQDMFAHGVDFVTVHPRPPYPPHGPSVADGIMVVDRGGDDSTTPETGFQEHLSGPYPSDTDDPHFVDVRVSPASVFAEDGAVSQRYSDACTVSLLYMAVFLWSVGDPRAIDAAAAVMERLAKRMPRFDNFTLRVFCRAMAPAQTVFIPPGIQQMADTAI